MEARDYSYIELLPNEAKYNLIINMDIDEFILFRESYPILSVTEYEQDILRHFYLKYKLPKAYSFDELVHYYHSSLIYNLEVTIKRNNVDDFLRLMENESKFNDDETNELLKYVKSLEMMDAIMDNNEEGYNEIYGSVYDTQNPILIKRMLSKKLEQTGELGDIYDDIYLLSEQGNEAVVDAILQFEPDYTDAIAGAIRGGHLNMAIKYLLKGEYDVRDLISILSSNLDNVIIALDLIPNLDREDLEYILSNEDLNSQVADYIRERYGL